MLKIKNSELGRITAQQYASMEKMPVVVVLDNVRSAQNVGAFFRTGDAFGLGEVVLSGITGTPPSKEIHKSALGAEFSVPWRYFDSTTHAIETLRAQGYTIMAVEQVHGATMLNEFRVENGKKYAFIFGNEVDGVEQSAVDMADGVIEIPQVGTKHSINVSVSGGVLLWSLFEQYSQIFNSPMPPNSTKAI
ncbi:MAG: TrmH family RNA methyltransferase [Mucinivorans sp.]